MTNPEQPPQEPDGEEEIVVGPAPWREANGRMTRADVDSYFKPESKAHDIAEEWLLLVSDLGDQAGITQGVQYEGDLVVFTEEFQTMLDGLAPIVHVRASILARINAGVNRVHLAGDSGFTVVTRSEYSDDPDIDALRQSLGEPGGS